jgi:hypothetical protein
VLGGLHEISGESEETPWPENPVERRDQNMIETKEKD